MDRWVGAKSMGAGWLWGLSHVSQNEQMFCQIHAHSSPTITIVKQYKVELRALFALASMDKQRVLTRTCYSYGVLERVLTPARIRIRTRARVYLCIICELSSSRHNYKQKHKQEHTIFTQICRKRPTDPLFVQTPPAAVVFIVQSPESPEESEATRAIWGDSCWLSSALKSC